MRDFNDEIDSNFMPTTEEDRLTCCNKSLAFREMQRWIETVTGTRFLHNEDFRRSLFDGVLLCNLLNGLKPGSISRINKLSTPLAGYDNIGKFLRSCEEDFGLSSSIMFESSDLDDLSDKPSDMKMESDRRLKRVLICLFHLAKSVENQLTKVTIDQNPFTILLESQDRKEMRRLMPNSKSADSNLNHHLSNIIHNQTPHYLATKAQETVSRMKANQEIRLRIVDDDEWQESLENWKEKRRQVISCSSLDEEHNNEGQELLELKEKARKMKSLREQLKDQNVPTTPLCNDKPPDVDKTLIPDIDDETKAMIERVKQKKLAEEHKRKFSLSPVHSPSFASDSEHSTSTTVDRHDEHIFTTLEKNEIDGVQSPVLDVFQDNIYEDSLSEQEISCTERAPDVRGRLITVKLTQRSKQDSDQLWGMDLAAGPSSIVISKVKIGSCADVCDIRKSDEIVSVNSEDVTNRSMEYIRNIFDQHAYVITNPETITICVRRTCSVDEEEEFYSDQSLAKNETDRNIFVDCTSSEQFEELLNLDVEDVTTDLDAPIEKEENSDQSHEIDEKARSPNVARTPEIPDNSPNFVPINSLPKYPKEEVTRKLSVQEKVAKIESRNIPNTMRLSSSWNVPAVNSIDPLFSKSTPNGGHSSEILGWNSENLQYRPIGGSNSSLSNLYNYWENETPKSPPTGHDKEALQGAPSQNEQAKLSSKVEGDECPSQVLNVIEASPTHEVKNTSCPVLAEYSVTSAEPDVTILVVNDPCRTNNSTSTQADIVKATTDRRSTNYTTTTASFENRSDQSNNLTRQMSDDETCSITVSNMHYSHPDNYPSATESVLQNLDSSINLNKNGINEDYTKATAVAQHNENSIKIGPSVSLSTDSSGAGVSKDNEKSPKTLISKKAKLFPIKNKSLLSKIIDKHNTASKSSDVSTISDLSCVEEITHQSDCFKVTDLDDMTTSIREVSLGNSDSDKRGIPTQKESYKSQVTILANQMPDKQPNVKIKNKQLKSHSNELSLENGIHPSSKISDFNCKPRNAIVTTGTNPSVPVVSSSTVFIVGSQSETTPPQVKLSSKSENVKSSKIESILTTRKVKKSNQPESNTLPELKRSASSKELRFEEVPSDKKWNSLKRGDNKRTSSCSDVSKNGSTSNAKQYLPPSTNNTLPSTTNTKSHVKSYSIERSEKQGSLSNKKVPQEPSKSRCDFCSASVGIGDLMVIEELQLHFHVKCFVCVECRQPLGDGKSDTDVRIRKSRLYCSACYNKKSSKAKHRNNSTSRTTSQSVANVSQSKETEI